MAYLLDSNGLLRLAYRPHPEHLVARLAVSRLKRRGERLCLLSQNIAEFWSVCTRPPSARGGFGLSIAEADRRARLLERRFELLPDGPEIHREWRRLLVSCAVSGSQVHDARIAAAMRVHGIGHILTFNVSDFRRYPGIVPVHPRDL